MTDIPPDAAKNVLLICSVGGTHEPVTASIRHWRPARILFLCSDKTHAAIQAALDAAAADGVAIPPGCMERTVLKDPQDLRQTLRDLRPLDKDVHRWRQRGDDYSVVVDFTGGTKVMSAALALVARRWKCTFAYVGGQERNKNGVGVVVSGREIQISQSNPWDDLGYQAVEDAVTVFNHGEYAAAGDLLDIAAKNAGKPEVKRELATLKAVVDAYAAWDRFDHKTAVQRFGDALRYRNDLAAIFPHESHSLIAHLEQHRERVAQLADQEEPTAEWVEDLLQNARRRAAEGRFDDAVARLYRVTEALAQLRLRDKHAILNTNAVPLDKLPESLQAEWSGRARDDRTITLGLQDSYRLLKEYGDEMGRQFFESDSADNDLRSLLVARNQSILAHGFRPVGKKVYTQLHEKLCSLGSLERSAALDWRLPTA